MKRFLLSSQSLGGLIALGIALSAFASGCSASDDEARAGNQTYDDSCFYGCADHGPSDAGVGGEEGLDAPDDDTDRDAAPLHALCGEGSCHPDRPTACASESLSSSEGAPSGDYDVESEPEAGEGEDERARDDGDGDDGTGALVPALACQVSTTAGGPSRSCEPSGSGEIDAPCMSAADCTPGLACVGPEHGGACRPYCCGDPEACPSGTFCDTREIRSEGAVEGSPAMVPVCVPATGCKLLEHEPCASLGLVCGIVRSDGTTSCVSPGEGKLDEPCPCALGYVCAKSQNKCLKLCHVNLSAQECPGGTCQGGTEELPQGFGVCVGGHADAG